MIEPSYKPDWFLVDRTTCEPLFGVPGIQLDRDALYRVHRSHLALLDSDEAIRSLDTHRVPVWEQRDRITEPLGFKLKRTQHQGCDFIRDRRGTLLGDEMRVGKTLTAAYSHDPMLGKLVVIAPLMVREVWLSWLRRIWPYEDIGIMTGRDFDPVEARKPIVFGHYDILFHWQNAERIGTLILDEAHVLTNRNARRTLAAVLLASVAERVIAATGTPIWNLPPGLWSILALIAPGAFGSYYDFCNRYAAPVPTAYGTKYTGISNGQELSQRLTEVMIRRRWVDVQADLPPITRNVIIVDLTDAERRKLDIKAESLRQSDRTNTAAALARYREALSQLKIGAAVAEAERFMRNGVPVVIWTWHRDTADQIVELLAGNGFDVFGLTGDVAVHRREGVINQWRSCPNGGLVATMSVAQVGIDLSHSPEPIFAEIDYTPPMISQAEMRTFTPTRGMNATYVVADHWADRKILSALTSKLEASEPVDLGTGGGAITAIDRAFRPEEEAADLERFMADLLAG